ncbi:MAG: FecR domain-containing protein [Sedimentisphaerales bacterium]|nr:FecR domain-containing protein [Sedimentisphaerales bacterium]
MPLDRHIELDELILKEIDGVITDQEFAELSDCLRHDPEALNYYLDFVTLCAAILKPGEVTLSDDSCCSIEDIGQSALWMALAENERTAETIHLEKEDSLSQIETQISVSNHRQSVSRVALYTAIFSTAALLLMIAFVVTHPRQSRDAVAILSGSSKAVWSDAADISRESNRLYTHSTLSLLEGFAEITFDNQAKIILQSPAQIDIEDFNQIFLHSGKLSAVVPPSAVGFVVRTAAATVVDYGTEFGVTADAAGHTEAHVFEGKVELRSGSDPIRFAGIMKLTKGLAGRVSETGELSTELMLAQPSSYVRRLPAKPTFGQPGKRIDLADIVGGGNGFGTGKDCVGIEPISGKVLKDLVMINRKLGYSHYFPVPEMPYIDGVFVPLGGHAPQIVTSQGHTFDQCPITDGCYWIEITNNPIASISGNSGGQALDVHLVRLGGIQFGMPLHPGIMMHSNTGITFDLDAIRASIPGVKIRRFRTMCGMSDTVIQQNVQADMWVLVDGQKRQGAHFIYNQTCHYTQMDVEIHEQDRFLTLISTDGGDGNGGDWTFFGDPALELETNNFQQ